MEPIIINGELYHHGITGQKWGKRNGPPYPLDKKTSNKVKHEGQKKKYLKEREDYKKIASGKKKLTKSAVKNNTGTNALMEEHDQEWEEMLDTARRSGLEDMLDGDYVWQHKFTYQNYGPEDDRHHLVSPADLAREFEAKNKDDIGMSQEHLERFHDNIEIINMENRRKGGRNNCTKCTFASELALRGIGIGGIPEDNNDPSCWAKAGRQTFPASQEAMSYWFKGAHTDELKIDDVDSYVDDFGDSCSGALGVRQRDDSGGHSIHWTKMGGKYYIEDSQVATTFEGSSFSDVCRKFAKEYPWFDVEDHNLRVTRLDNCEIDWENAKEDSCIKGDRVWNHRTKKIVDTW